jgi:hypothetical protein
MALEHLDFESASKLLKTRFRVQMEAAQSIELELSEVTTPKRLPATERKPGSYESFSLIFQGPAGPLLPQRIYTLERPDCGPSELFLVPIARDANGIKYEAVFNRLVPQEERAR